MFKASAYKLNMFNTCAQQYKFTYIDYLANEYKQPKPYLTMGAHVHNALKDFYEVYTPEQRNYELLEQLLRKRWTENRNGFADRDDEARWGVKALNMLRLFAHRMDVTITPSMLEDYYDMEVSPDLKLIGRIDRADLLEDNTLHVIDYKTGKYDADEVNELQLILYAAIVGANEKYDVSRASYLYLPTWEWHSIEITEERIREAVQEVEKQVQTIEGEKQFAPQINKYCKNCDFLEICPEKKQIEVLIESGEL